MSQGGQTAPTTRIVASDFKQRCLYNIEQYRKKMIAKHLNDPDHFSVLNGRYLCQRDGCLHAEMDALEAMRHVTNCQFTTVPYLSCLVGTVGHILAKNKVPSKTNDIVGRHHTKEHPNHVLYCPFCNYTDTNGSYFLTHIKKMHLHICQTCDYGYDDEEEYNQHMIEKHSKVCPHADCEEVVLEKDMKEHLRSHQTFYCHQLGCGKEYKQLKSLRTHYKKKHRGLYDPSVDYTEDPSSLEHEMNEENNPSSQGATGQTHVNELQIDRAEQNTRAYKTPQNEWPHETELLRSKKRRLCGQKTTLTPAKEQSTTTASTTYTTSDSLFFNSQQVLFDSEFEL